MLTDDPLLGADTMMPCESLVMHRLYFYTVKFNRVYTRKKVKSVLWNFNCITKSNSISILFPYYILGGKLQLV
jgi:hypothetical protein